MQQVLSCLQVDHDAVLLLLAAAVCGIGVYGAFSIARQAGRSTGDARRTWALVAVGAAGCTAWATHMIALLAYRPGMLSAFEPALTAFSLLLATGGIGAGIMLTLGRHERLRRFWGGLVIGIGVGLLHYVGQAAYLVTGTVGWEPTLVAVSLVAGLALFGLSTMIAGERTKSIRPAAAPLLILAIAVLHIGGMMALRLEYDPAIQLPTYAVSPDVLAPIVAAVSIGLGLLALLGLRMTLHAKAMLRKERLRLGELANLALEGLAICEGDVVMTANESLARLCERSRADLTGCSLGDLLLEANLGDLPEHQEADANIVAASGRLVPVRLLRSEVNLGGRPQIVFAFRDQRERLRSEERIRILAFTDHLTGLANRTRFHDRLAELAGPSHVAAASFTLMMIDLDGFKAVNDAFGHGSGDEVLRIVAERLRSAVDQRHMVARLGGDEFAVLIDDSADPLEADRVGRAIIAAIEEPIAVENQTVHISASIGVMTSGSAFTGTVEMLTAADLALYDAKANGRARVRLFTPELRRVAMERSGTAMELQEAWDERHFELYYQPQVDLRTGAITGAEALIRWNYPYFGVRAPASFLSVLEGSRLAVPVGDWILREACRQAVAWRRQGLSDFRLGVNLFAVQLRSPDFVERVGSALESSGLPSDGLELEITENIVLQNERIVSEHLRRLRAMGVGIAFDDFGTGYASLTMLKQLDISRLKIDRSFVRDIETNRMDRAIVDAVVRMAEGADLSVIAEGIETAGQMRHLRERVAEGQGYLFGKPMPAADFATRFVRAGASVTKAA